MDDRQLRSVQILRGLAAFGVVLTHLVAVERKYLPGPPITSHGLELGATGVDLFFVISGFIMTSITIGRPHRPGDSRRFLFRRFTRIYPLYWIYFAMILPLFLLDPSMVNSSHGRPNPVTSFFLIPDQHLPLLIVAWTLSFELYFYLIYASIFRFLDGWRSVAALLAWGGLVAAGNLLLHPTTQQPGLHLVLNPLNLEFIAGCFIARFAARAGRPAATACLLAAVVVFWLGAQRYGIAPTIDPHLAWARVMVYGSAASLLLIGALGWESAARRAPRVFVAIGDSSYSLYLSHVLTIGAIGWIWHRVLAQPTVMNHVAMVAVAVCGALVWGYISYVVAEQPLLSLSRRALRRIDPSLRGQPARAAAGPA